MTKYIFTLLLTAVTAYGASQIATEATLTTIKNNQTNGTQTFSMAPGTSFAVNNFPATQPVSGSLGRSWLLSGVNDSVAVSNFPGTYPVTGTFWQTTQPVSLATLPNSSINILPNNSVGAIQSGTWNINNVSGTVVLPTGAATATRQDTGNTSIASVDTKLVSDDVSSSGSIQVSGNAVTINTNGMGTASVFITGTFTTGSAAFETTLDGSTWFAVACVDTIRYGVDIPVGCNTPDGGPESPECKSGLFWCPVAATKQFRVRSNGFDNTATANVRASKATQVINQVQSAGYSDIAQIAGQTPDLGSGTIGTGTLRVVLPTNQPTVPVSLATLPNSSVTLLPNSSVGAIQSGTWTVQPGNTANTTAWKVDGSAVTQPISVVTLPNHSVSQAGTWTVQPGNTANTTAWKVDGSAVTQPVSMAVAPNSSVGQFGTWNITNISGTVSLPTGAATETSVANLALTPGASTATQKGNLGLAAVTTAAPTYVSGQTNALSLNTSGALRIDGSAANQPVTLTAETTKVIGTVNMAAGQTIAATGPLTDTQLRATAVPISMAVAPNSSVGQFGTWNLNNISGTVSLPTGAATETTLGNIALAQGSSTASQKGNLGFGAVTTAAPAYVTGQSSPISLTTAGSQRISLDAETTKVIGTVNVASAQTIATTNAGTFAVQQSAAVGNPCANPASTLVSITGATSGTTAVQIVALSGTTKIYICSMTIIGVSGTTPTFSLVQGTGSNCVTTQTTVKQAFATTAGTVYNFVTPVAVGVAGNALCYLDGGTTPVQNYQITYVQI